MSKISNMKGVRAAIQIPKAKIAHLAQAAAVQNTWYTVATLKNVSLRNTVFEVDQAETIECELTLDEWFAAAKGTQICVPGSSYKLVPYNSWSGTPYLDVEVNTKMDDQVPIDAKNVLVRIRKTSAVGVAQIDCSVVYHQY